MISTISPSALADLRRRGEKITLIDVRTPAEYAELHVAFAHNMPLDALDPLQVAQLGGDGPVYFICKSGGRSHRACEQMTAAGFGQVVNVEDGTAACEAAGIPMIRGPAGTSPER